jgi:hypothetical protein
MAKRKLQTFSLLALSALTLTACGGESFRPLASSVLNDAPGNFQVPPKIDILLAVDDTGSMSSIYRDIYAQVPAFLSGLEGANFDYRFAITPLTTRRALNQIVASKYDPNWGSEWKEPYPGAQQSMVDQVDPSFFRKVSSYTHFLGDSDILPGGNEPGLLTIYDALTVEAPLTDFLRSDALLVVVHIGNGQDVSCLPTADRGDGVFVPQAPFTWDSGLFTNESMPCGGGRFAPTAWLSSLLSIKANPGQFKMYSLSNASGVFQSTRYRKLATSISGSEAVFNIANQNMNQVLSSISSQLNSQKLQFRTRYMFLGQEPNPATIKVRKFPGGTTGAPIEIPNDPVNGWTYAGNISAYAIDAPIPLNFQTGYAIELHGNARLIGDDRADIEYTPAGFSGP